MMQNKDMLIVSVCTLITVFAWIVFDVYHASVTSNITQVQQQLIAPLNPKFNQLTLERIKAVTRH